MSRGIKKVASIALPIVGSIVGGPIGGAIGGALGGAIGGGGLKGAAIGGITGYASAGLTEGLVGTTAAPQMLPWQVGPSYPGSGVLGAATGGGLRALTSGISSAASSVNPALMGITSIGNQLLTQSNADTAEEAARIQSDSITRAIEGQKPYTQAGEQAINQISQINANPAGYIQNNPLYKSLANDAQSRLLANQAAKGKVGSGGTAAALQDQLLQIGNGLVQQQIGNLNQQANIGQTAANQTSNLAVSQGNVNAAGAVGANNAYQSGYQNQINTLLAMQNLGRTPSYSPNPLQFV